MFRIRLRRLQLLGFQRGTNITLQCCLSLLEGGHVQLLHACEWHLCGAATLPGLLGLGPESRMGSKTGNANGCTVRPGGTNGAEQNLPWSYIWCQDSMLSDVDHSVIWTMLGRRQGTS